MSIIADANIGGWAFWLLYIWLASSIACSMLSARKGYGEKPGLGTGLLLSAFGIIVWLIVPAKAGSRAKTGRGKRAKPPKSP